MAIREYIGARYVPRFLGTYDATQIYDALDVVDNGAGTSYIAKKTVPAGTALTNTEYWFVYGASSGAIIQLQNDVAALQNEKQPEISERTFLFLGDSYDVMTNYIDSIASYINCKAFTKRSLSGAGFVKSSTSQYPQRYYYNILSSIDPLTDEEKATVTDVVICSAIVNDKPDREDILDAMTTLDTFLRTQITTLRNIHLYPVGWACKTYTRQLNIRNNLGAYSEGSAKLGWIYADCNRVMRSCAFFDPTDADGIHPTSDGGKYMAYAVANTILTGSCNFEFTPDPTAPNPFQYVYTPSFSANMGSPNISTGGGKFVFTSRIKSNGDIAVISTSYSRITNITVPNDAGYMDITLTPDTANRDVFPAIDYCLHPVLTGNLKFVVFGQLMKGTDDALIIRIYFNNQTGAEFTSAINVYIPEIIL